MTSDANFTAGLIQIDERFGRIRNGFISDAGLDAGVFETAVSIDTVKRMQIEITTTRS